MVSYHYKNPREHSEFAGKLRKQAPKTERLLWNALSAVNKTTDLKFRRQHPLHPYIVDFACVKARLVIELDGPSHNTRQDYDVKREADLRNRKWTVVRFSNEEVEKNTEGVVRTIMESAYACLASLP